jgi:hypothetical protein
MTAPSWSRYGSRLRRLCARAGCNAPAVATLRFEPTERLAWLAELDESAARTQGDLCQRHAAALVLPRGWELHDERRIAYRDAQPVDARPVEVQAADAPVADAAPAETAAESGADPLVPVAVEMEEPIERVDELVEVVEAVEAVESDGEPPAEIEPEPAVASNGNGTRAVPAQFGTTDDDAVDETVSDELDTILDARTPLLQRAFRNARPQGSDD